MVWPFVETFLGSGPQFVFLRLLARPVGNKRDRYLTGAAATLPGGLPSTELPWLVATRVRWFPRRDCPIALSQPPSGVHLGFEGPLRFGAAFLCAFAFFSSAALSVMAKAAMARDAIIVFETMLPLSQNASLQ